MIGQAPGGKLGRRHLVKRTIRLFLVIIHQPVLNFLSRLGQRQLRRALAEAKATLKNQLKKPTATPTLRWIFQYFQAVHLLEVAGTKQVSNLTQERKQVLFFLPERCRRYYLMA